MQRIVHINGVDGSGKSSQVELLGNLTDVTRAERDETGFETGLSPADSFEWWFHEEHHGRLAAAMARTITSATATEGNLLVTDRGPRMHLAALSATIMTTDAASYEEASHRAAGLLENATGHNVTAAGEHELDILLHGRHRTLTGNGPFTAEQNARYTDYQTNLDTATSAILGDGHAVVINTAARPIVQVQHHIRTAVHERHPLSDPEFCNSDAPIVGFGGLTESGKSTHAQFLQDEHGFMRLKLRAFDALFREAHGTSAPADRMAMQLALFVHNHPFMRGFSIESMHRPELAGAMKRYFGDQFVLTYMDADPATRLERTRAEMHDATADPDATFTRKDAKKQAGGAHLLGEIADITVDTATNVFNESTTYLATKLGLPKNKY